MVADLVAASAVVQQTIDRGQYLWLPHDPLADNCWTTYKPLFASFLPIKEWGVVTIGAMNCSLFKGLRDSALAKSEGKFEPDDESYLKTCLAQIDAAVDALRPLIDI